MIGVLVINIKGTGFENSHQIVEIRQKLGILCHVMSLIIGTQCVVSQFNRSHVILRNTFRADNIPKWDLVFIILLETGQQFIFTLAQTMLRLVCSFPVQACSIAVMIIHAIKLLYWHLIIFHSEAHLPLFGACSSRLLLIHVNNFRPLRPGEPWQSQARATNAWQNRLTLQNPKMLIFITLAYLLKSGFTLSFKNNILLFLTM